MKYLHHLLFLVVIVTTVSKSQPLDNILLVINYNWAHYQSIPLLKKIYQNYFANIVFYGPRQSRDVTGCSHDDGYISYVCVADAMKRYPQYQGYLFLMDDCILAARKVMDLDQSKIWMPEIPFLSATRGNFFNVTHQAKASSWGWWHSKWGWQAMEKAYNELPELYKKNLNKNIGKSQVMASYSDVLYIPGCYREQFIELAEIFGKHRVFLEMAFPTMLSCLCKPDEWIWLKGHGTHRKHQTESFKYSVYFNHPLKLSDPRVRAFIEKVFEAKRL
ncbi:MAG TPA: hypothetical protein VLG71_02670 [Candidatus Limnocylindria bacterium]|nr:hypothetical protein [Candidatus Limnocylindria bacterium]